MDRTTEEIELQDLDRSGVRLSPAPVDKTEQRQESTFTKPSCKICSRSLQEPRPQSCCGQHVCESCTPENEPCPHCGSAREDLTETVYGTRKRRKTSVTVEPTADSTCTAESATMRLRSAGRKKVKVSTFSICKERIKSRVTSNTFYTSNGYNMQIEFKYKPSKDYRNNVNVYVYTCPGKNDEKRIWPLKGKVRIFIDRRGDQHQISEITGTWNKPPPRNPCKGELNIPYEDLKEDCDGMLQFYVTDD